MKLIAAGVTFSAAIVRSPRSRDPHRRDDDHLAAAEGLDGVFDGANGARLRAPCNAQLACHDGWRPPPAPARRGDQLRHRTTYLPRTSPSRFARSPTRQACRFVCSHVKGMIWTSNSPARSSATVRLMPSTATDPSESAAGRGGRECDRDAVELAFLGDRRDRPGGVHVTETKCPPMRLSARSGRSRFTSAPGPSAPRLVTRNVSARPR